MDNRTVTIKKLLDAPIQLVWEAWTNPEHIAQWWSPKGIKTEIIKHDFVEGGAWRFEMPCPMVTGSSQRGNM